MEKKIQRYFIPLDGKTMSNQMATSSAFANCLDQDQTAKDLQTYLGSTLSATLW